MFYREWLPRLATTGCVNDPDGPGLEYMPDMYHSPAVEAYVDYGQDPYQVGEEVLRRSAGFSLRASQSLARFHSTQTRWHSRCRAYPNTVEGYEAAGANLSSPLAHVGQAEIEAGQEIYTLMCTQCHGEEGKGRRAEPQRTHQDSELQRQAERPA